MIITGRNLYGQARAKYRGWRTILRIVEAHENGETIQVRIYHTGAYYWVVGASY